MVVLHFKNFISGQDRSTFIGSVFSNMGQENGSITVHSREHKKFRKL